MNCENCIKLNPVPDCIDSEAFDFTGITFPDYLNEVIMAKISNLATGRNTFLPLLTNGSGQITGGFDVATIYPLMQHYYKLDFTSDGVTIPFTLTNPDGSTETGCCMEFTTAHGITGSDDWPLSSTVCAV